MIQENQGYLIGDVDNNLEKIEEVLIKEFQIMLKDFDFIFSGYLD